MNLKTKHTSPQKKEANEQVVQEKEVNLLVLLRLFVDKNVRQNSLISNEEGWRKPARTSCVETVTFIPQSIEAVPELGESLYRQECFQRYRKNESNFSHQGKKSKGLFDKCKEAFSAFLPQ